MDDVIPTSLLIILLIFCCSCFLNINQNQTEEYELTSESIILDKFITFSKFGTPSYYLVYKDDNGTILQKNVNPDVYYRFEIDEEKEVQYEKNNLLNQ